MFDMTKNPWFVIVNNKQEFDAFQQLAFDSGVRWQGDGQRLIKGPSVYPTIIATSSLDRRAMCFNMSTCDIGERQGSLPDRQAHIIRERYLTDQPKTLSKLSEEFGVSHQRIDQIEKAGIKKMKDFVGDYVHEYA